EKRLRNGSTRKVSLTLSLSSKSKSD
ncbi:putative sH3 domain protein, partial [Vibrio parahaemolyticus V-223/04]